MKKLLLLFFIILAFKISTAQWLSNGTAIYYNSGHVGIGTSSPSTYWGRVLQVYDNNNAALSVKTSVADWQLVTDASGGLHIRDITGGGNAGRLFIAPNGRIGIGTTSPTKRLDITSENEGIISIANGNLSGAGSRWDINVVPGNTFLLGRSGVANDLAIDGSGNVGIGTTSPQQKLHVAGTVKVGFYTFLTEPNGGLASVIGNNLYAGATNNTLVRQNNSDPGNYISLTYNRGIIFGTGITSPAGSEVADNTNERMRIDLNGNVGIGTTSPQAKLAVNGDIFSKKIKVTQTGWPDYVFHHTYRLPSLMEVQEFIQNNNHLPGIPSAKEVEEKGLDLGDNQAALLKKIEELTLYIIEQEKEIKKLQDQNTELLDIKKDLQAIKAKLQTIN